MRAYYICPKYAYAVERCETPKSAEHYTVGKSVLWKVGACVTKGAECREMYQTYKNTLGVFVCQNALVTGEAQAVSSGTGTLCVKDESNVSGVILAP